MIMLLASTAAMRLTDTMSVATTHEIFLGNAPKIIIALLRLKQCSGQILLASTVVDACLASNMNRKGQEQVPAFDK